MLRLVNGSTAQLIPEWAQRTLARLDNPFVEECGYILDDFTIIPMNNVSATPKSSFAFDPDQQRLIVSKFRARLEGIFHTHPSGAPGLSEADVIGWPRVPHFRYWTVAGGVIREWTKRGEQVTCIWASERWIKG